MLTVLSYVAATLTTCSFVPQALQVIKTKNTEGISLGMYIMFTLGLVLWSIYGVIAKEAAVAMANIITLPFAATILTYKIKDTLKN